MSISPIRSDNTACYGTAGGDSVHISRAQGIHALLGLYEVNINGQTQYMTEKELENAQFGSGAGSDTLIVDSNVNAATTPDGAGASDGLEGRRGNDELYGARGNNRLQGGIVPSTLRMRDAPPIPLTFDEQVKVALEHARAAGNSFMEGVIQDAKKSPANLALPKLISSAPPEKQAFPPFQFELELSQEQTHKLKVTHPELLASLPKDSTLYLIYSNDGRLPLNPGRGSDQGRTASFALGAHHKSNKDDPASPEYHFELTVVDMYTPRPLGTPMRGPGLQPRETTYATEVVYPYSGIVSAEFGITTHADGGWRLDRLIAIGADIPRWGKFLQDAIHNLSNSPHYEWQERQIKPLVEGEVGATHQSRTMDLKVFGMSLNGQVEVSAAIRGGTRRSEADLSGKLILKEARLRGPDATYWETALGAKATGFLRYNDGRTGVDSGVEAGFTGEFAIHFGDRNTLRFTYTDIQSTDPAYQTNTKADDLALGQRVAPIAVSTGKGGHGLGSITFEHNF